MEENQEGGGHESTREEARARRTRHGCAALLDARPRSRRRRRRPRRGAGVRAPPPTRARSFSIPAQTARAHGIYAQRAPCHGALCTMVSFYIMSPLINTLSPF